jgi:hypothetical protein
MGQGNIQNYQGAIDGLEEIVLGTNRWIKVYNSSGGNLTNGDVVIVSYRKASASADYPNTNTPATTTVAVIVGVVDTTIAAQVSNTTTTSSLGTTIPNLSYGYVQVRGYNAKIAIPASTAAERYLSATNGTKVATDVAAVNADGVTGITAKCFAITKTADTGATGFTDGVLLGREVTI